MLGSPEGIRNLLSRGPYSVTRFCFLFVCTFKAVLTEVLDPKIDICDKLVSAFGKNVDDYNRCTLSNVFNSTVCLNCMTPYFHVLKRYSDLQAKQNGSAQSCLDHIRSGPIDYTTTMYESIRDSIWKASQCDLCFNSYNPSGESWYPFLNNQSQQVLIALEDLNNCTTVASVAQGNTTVCQQCEHVYTALNDLVDTPDGNHIYLCVDLATKIRNARESWYDKYRCIPTHSVLSTEDIIMFSGCFVLLLTIVILYGGSFMQGERRIPNLKTYNRFTSVDGDSISVLAPSATFRSRAPTLG